MGKDVLTTLLWIIVKACLTGSANLYSLIETAKANGLEPYAYLRYLFSKLPKAESVEAIEALLPGNLNKD